MLTDSGSRGFCPTLNNGQRDS